MFHTLTLEIPTMADFRNGASDGVIVAQCSCGRYEFTTSTEAAYWHWLHRTTLSATPAYLLNKLVHQPMPEGWTEPVDDAVAVAAPDPSTIADRSTWIPLPHGREFTHPGIPGWTIIVAGPRTFRVTGLRNGIDLQPVGTVRTWDQAIALIAYCHGA